MSVVLCLAVQWLCQLSLLIFAQILVHMMVEAAIIGNSSSYKIQAVQILVRYVRYCPGYERITSSLDSSLTTNIDFLRLFSAKTSSISLEASLPL